ncbi:MAG TPA: hypothetical protein VGZ29_13660 [Terriglobia bacterium]|nr:hypothetical protein [Terriglobia bacterium]
MGSVTEDVKHESERGELLKVLVDWGLEWMPFYELRTQFQSRTDRRLTDAELKFQLNYLEQRGYAERKMLRAGLADLELLVVRATTKAADLLTHVIPADPGVAF